MVRISVFLRLRKKRTPSMIWVADSKMVAVIP